MNVLIVEDYAPLTFVLGALMRKLAQRVEIAHTLEEGMAWLARKNGFHLVLLDLGLPDSTQEQTIEAIRRIKTTGRRVVVITGSDWRHVEDQAKECGADACFYKNDPEFLESLTKQLSLAT